MKSVRLGYNRSIGWLSLAMDWRILNTARSKCTNIIFDATFDLWLSINPNVQK